MSEFNELIDSYYRAWFRFHPERAVDLGVDGYSDLLDPYGDDDIGALITLNEKLLDAVDTINLDKLDADQKIDLQLMHGQALIESKQLIDIDWRTRDPGRFLPVNAIYQLTIRPVKDRCGSLQKRLAAIPGHLRAARGHLLSEPESIPSVWLESAITEAQEGARYLRGLESHPFITPCKLFEDLEKAARALDDYARFLERDIAGRAQGDFACGRDMFELKLKYLHGLDIDADSLRNFGQSLYDRVWKELIAVTQELQGDDNVMAMTDRIRQMNPAGESILEAYRAGMKAAHKFLKQHDLVTIPETNFLHVVETPRFLQHRIPFAAYMDPMPTDPSQTGYYYVTPPQDDDSRGEHNLIGLRHTCVHEAWPGHHLQFVTANHDQRSRTLPRLTNPSATLYEGWALYSEQLMQEQGFLDQPESQFILLKDRLWRALRVMLDVDLHVHGQTLDTAAKTMCDNLGFSRAQAMGDLNWYTHAPTVPMGYATGWALITQTRERLQAIQSESSLKDFHDRLLSAGSIGLPWVLRHCFGEPLWQSVRQSVFPVN